MGGGSGCCLLMPFHLARALGRGHAALRARYGRDARLQADRRGSHRGRRPNPDHPRRGRTQRGLADRAGYAGFSADQPTAWVIGGLMGYLTAAENDQLITRVSQRSAPGSWLIAVYAAGDPLTILKSTGDRASRRCGFSAEPEWAVLLDEFSWAASVTSSAHRRPRRRRRFRALRGARVGVLDAPCQSSSVGSMATVSPGRNSMISSPRRWTRPTLAATTSICP